MTTRKVVNTYGSIIHNNQIGNTNVHDEWIKKIWYMPAME